eukprot:TRINITY_DN8375_c0_g1_i3.p1 TRINITY_DN8375_c0_g1~~TRINITY_DN8375_c0_g1_i3.p1  ORF type:complete len:100 (-),score=11.61 TRINITY_DN8375_c0_g1_i3:345-644(-)
MNSLRRNCEVSFRLALAFFLFHHGWADDPKHSNSHAYTKRNSGLNILIICLAIIAIIGIATLLYKMWQKRKREEQYARLLKLFEEDDELEAEMGLRDEF